MASSNGNQARNQPSITQACLPSDRLVDLVRWRRWFLSWHGKRRRQLWANQHPAMLDWSQPLPIGIAHSSVATDFEAPVSSQKTDAMQAALVALTQNGDADAAITLLVQLRPGLVRLVHGATARRSWQKREAIEEVRAVFFEVLSRHSLERRPSKIASNLLLDTRQRLNRQTHSPRDQDQLAPTSYPAVDSHAPALVYEILRSAARTMPGSPSSHKLTADLAFRAWVLEQPKTAIAEEFDLAPEGVRTRLHRFRTAIRAEAEFGLSA